MVVLFSGHITDCNHSLSANFLYLFVRLPKLLKILASQNNLASILDPVHGQSLTDAAAPSGDDGNRPCSFQHSSYPPMVLSCLLTTATFLGTQTMCIRLKPACHHFACFFAAFFFGVRAF